MATASNKPCFNWNSTGTCKFGNNCHFSHGPVGPPGGVAPGSGPPINSGGQRPPPVKCKNWQNTGSCQHGQNCRFVHDSSVAPATDGALDGVPSSGAENRGPKLCTSWQNRGFCKFGANCRFVHSVPGQMPMSESQMGPGHPGQSGAIFGIPLPDGSSEALSAPFWAMVVQALPANEFTLPTTQGQMVSVIRRGTNGWWIAVDVERNIQGWVYEKCLTDR